MCDVEIKKDTKLLCILLLSSTLKANFPNHKRTNKKNESSTKNTCKQIQWNFDEKKKSMI